MLDFKVRKEMECNEEEQRMMTIIRHEFYKKKMAAKVMMMMMKSAIPHKMRMTTLSQEVIRRLNKSDKNTTNERQQIS